MLVAKVHVAVITKLLLVCATVTNSCMPTVVMQCRTVCILRSRYYEGKHAKETSREFRKHGQLICIQRQPMCPEPSVCFVCLSTPFTMCNFEQDDCRTLLMLLSVMQPCSSNLTDVEKAQGGRSGAMGSKAGLT